MAARSCHSPAELFATDQVHLAADPRQAHLDTVEGASRGPAAGHPKLHRRDDHPAFVRRGQPEARKDYLGKLNTTLIQILKQEWPHNWPSFIPEIVSSSKGSLSICENNMAILRLLSEEIFDYSAEQMTTSKTKSLKNQMCGEFGEVFQLCSEVLEKAQKPSLIKATLETMLRFLNWIPLGYIFETNVIDNLIGRFLEVTEFRNVTLKCLSEIANLNVGAEYDAKFVVLFNMVMTSVNRMIPPATNIATAYETSSDSDQELVLTLRSSSPTTSQPTSSS